MDANKFRVVYIDDSTMQPTVPAWVSWYRRVRPAPAPERAHTPAPRARAPARLAVYTSVFNSPDDRNLHLIRLEDMLDNLYQRSPSPSEWVKRLNTNPDLWHFAPDSSKLHRKKFLDYQQRFHNYPSLNVMVPPGSATGAVTNSRALAGLASHGGGGGHASTGGGGHTHAGGAVWGGWAAGAVLLGLLVLIVRAAEKCLDRRLFKTRRRQSEEWPTPNVMATSLQNQNGDVGLPHLDDSEFSQGQRSSDLPPPYSECALKTNKNFTDLTSEEPPPPYSDCLVAFSNKDIPTVHIHRRRTIDEPHTSSEIDNVQNDLIETRHRIDEDNNFDDSTMRVELVFDNGRIVERTIDIDSTDNVPDIVANVGETVIRNGSVDDNVAGNNSRESVIFV